MKQLFFGLMLAALSGMVVPARAQLPPLPRSLGMGGADIADARGGNALFRNPANLGLSGNPRWSLALPQLSAGGTTLGLRPEDLAEAGRLNTLSEQERAAILARVPESGTDVQVDLVAPLFLVSAGSFALGASYGASGSHTLGRDLVELIFEGYETGRTDYSVEPTGGERATYLDVAGGFGRRMGPLSVGIAGHYYRGLTLMRARLFEPRYDLAAQDFEIDYIGVFSQGGQGYGIDLGAAAQPTPELTLSGVLANVFTRMKWNEELRWSRSTLNRATLEDSESLQEIASTFQESDSDVDPGAAPLEVVEAAHDLYKQAYFPTTLRVGAAYTPTRKTNLAVSYQEKLTAGRLGERWDRTVSAGVEQHLTGSGGRGIALRAGYASNLAEGRLLSAGFALGPLQVGVGKLQDSPATGTLRSGWTATFGITAEGRR